MNRPQPGLMVPCHFRDLHDADTIEVSLDLRWRLRLIDCWAPEVKGAEKPKGLAAKEFARQILEDCDDLYVHIPAPQSANILTALSFERIPAHLWVSSDRTLNEMLVLAGHATQYRVNT